MKKNELYEELNKNKTLVEILIENDIECDEEMFLDVVEYHDIDKMDRELHEIIGITWPEYAKTAVVEPEIVINKKKEELKRDKQVIASDKKIAQPNIYCDMDGVLTNFNKAAKDLMGTNKWSEKKLWRKVEKTEGYWSGMEWNPGGKEIWDAIKQYNPTILTSMPRTGREQCDKEKREWVQKHLGSDVPVITVVGNKYKHAKPGDILIDDMTKNTKPWSEADGIAILHKDLGKTLKAIEDSIAQQEI